MARLRGVDLVAPSLKALRAGRLAPARSLWFNLGSNASTSSGKTQTMASQQLVDSMIAENTVAMFSKSGCPYCRKAKGIIQSLNLEGKKVSIIELDERDDGAQIQDYLLQKTGQRTVPNIFIAQQHIGGADALSAKPIASVQKLVDGN